MSDAVGELRALLQESRSGEYVCVKGEEEVHVFVQHGRIAWAADTRHPHAFTHFLTERGGISEERLAEVIDECAKHRLPIGEKLIEQGLATEAMVHGALRRQVELAMETLVEMPDARTVFLARKYRAYRLDLTFDLEGFFPSQPRRVNELAPISHPEALLQQLSEHVPGLKWAQLYRGETALTGARVGSGEAQVPAPVIDGVLAQQADVAIFRSEGGAIVGAGIPGDATLSLWCEVGCGAALGGVVAQLWTLLGLGALTPPPQREPGPPSAVGPPSLAVDVALGSLLREPMLHGVFAGEHPATLCGASRTEAITSMARARWPLLGVAPGEQPRVGILSGGLWCLGARRPRSTEMLWLVAEGRTPQGLLWGHLPAIERSLAERAATPLRHEAEAQPHLRLVGSS